MDNGTNLKNSPEFREKLLFVAGCCECQDAWDLMAGIIPNPDHYRSLLVQWKEDGYPDQRWLLELKDYL